MRIAVLDDYQAVARSMADWGRLGAEMTFLSEHIADSGGLAGVLAGHDVVVAMRERTPFPADLLERLPDLRLLVTTGMRNAAIDVDAATRLGVTVCGTPSPSHATPELAMALILAVARGLIGEVESMRRGGWQVGLGRDLHGATLGLVGLGRLGSRVAAMAAAFDMSVLAWSQNLTPLRAEDAGAEAVSRSDLFARSDFVSIHLRLSDRTRGLIGSDDLGRMRPGSFLVNTSRGEIVDEAALLDAVANGPLAGAAVDVYTEEPLPPDHPFRSEPRIITTPHIGYVTRETYRVFYEGAVEAIASWKAGEPIRELG